MQKAPRIPLLSLALLLSLTSPALSAPPTFDPPTELKARGGFAIFTPPADCVSVKYFGLDGEEPFPVDLVGGSKTAFVFMTKGLAKPRYDFQGVASSSTGEQVAKRFTVVITDAPPPVVPPPAPVPGVPLYFLLVRPDGEPSVEFARVLTMPQWAALTTAGHTFKPKTVTESKAFGITVTTAPCVVVLKTRPDGKTMEIVTIKPFPATGDDILNLPK